MSRIYPIVIRKHTKVRRKMSNYVIDLRYFKDEDPHSMDNWEEKVVPKTPSWWERLRGKR